MINQPDGESLDITLINQSSPEIICVPSFIAKLWDMLNNTSVSDVISWREDGLSFVVKNREKLTVKLLPMYFKHNNLSSFIRQLNKYGFRKIQSIENSPELEFAHECFIKDKPKLLLQIKRKHNESKHVDPDTALKDLLLQVHSLKKVQENFEEKLTQIENSTKALTKETFKLNKKQKVQQQIIKNVMAFLANLVKHSEDDLNVSVIFPKSNNFGKNLIAISDNPHIPEAGEAAPFGLDENLIFMNETESSASTNLLNKDQNQFVLLNLNDTMVTGDDSGIISQPCMSPSVDNNKTFKVYTLDENQGNVLIPDYLEVCYSDETGNTEGMDPSSSGLASESQNVAKCQIATSEPGGGTLLFDIDLPEISSEQKPVVSKLDLSPNQSDDLENHISEVESNLNLLKEVMSNAKLNLDINEVLDLFSPQPVSSPTLESNLKTEIEQSKEISEDSELMEILSPSDLPLLDYLKFNED